jgi:hypothetical protein
MNRPRRRRRGFSSTATTVLFLALAYYSYPFFKSFLLIPDSTRRLITRQSFPERYPRAFTGSPAAFSLSTTELSILTTFAWWEQPFVGGSQDRRCPLCSPGVAAPTADSTVRDLILSSAIEAGESRLLDFIRMTRSVTSATVAVFVENASNSKLLRGLCNVNLIEVGQVRREFLSRGDWIRHLLSAHFLCSYHELFDRVILCELIGGFFQGDPFTSHFGPGVLGLGGPESLSLQKKEGSLPMVSDHLIYGAVEGVIGLYSVVLGQMKIERVLSSDTFLVNLDDCLRSGRLASAGLNPLITGPEDDLAVLSSDMVDPWIPERKAGEGRSWGVSIRLTGFAPLFLDLTGALETRIPLSCGAIAPKNPKRKRNLRAFDRRHFGPDIVRRK